MKLSIRLNKQIDCNKLCQQIEKVISNFDPSPFEMQDCLVVIDIVKPTDGSIDVIPKIEYKCST